MSFPVISDLALTVVDIDPYVQYTYVLPVTGETTCGFTADANFTMSMAGRVLTLKYVTGIFPAILDPAINEGDFSNLKSIAATVTEVPITLFASNGDGTTELIVTFRIPGATISELDAPGTVVTSGQQSYLVTDTSGMTVGDPIRLIAYYAVTPTSVDLVPNPAFVHTIIDSTHVKISATVGGSAITAGSTVSVPAGHILYVFTYPRAYPVISSEPFLSVEPQATVSYSIDTVDDLAELIMVKGLPVDLKFTAGGMISGRAPASGIYPITLIARLGATDSLRTMVLSIDET